MSVICFVLQIRLFLFIRSCIEYSSENNRSTDNENSLAPLSVLLNSVSSSNNSRVVAVISSRNDHQNQLELKSAKILVTGILPFCLVHLPLTISSVVVVLIRSYWGTQYASWLYLVIMILRELILLHLIYIPSIYMGQSREFRAAGARFCHCCPRKRVSRTARNHFA